MSATQHWHPVLTASKLRKRPIGVRFAGGREAVVFRTESGQLGALSDHCPHRRMRLSRGKVEGEHLRCPYHGWGFQPNGEGHAPSNEKLRPCTQHYDVVERYGAIWIKEPGSNAQLPELGGPDYSQVFCMHYHIDAPLELVVDNFAEIEHAVTTHILLAYDADGIAQTESQVDIGEDQISIRNVGPQKRVPELLRRFIGYGKDDLFVGEGVIHFSPVWLELKNYWLNPTTQARRYTQMAGAVVFNPVSRTQTDLMLLGFSSRHDNFAMRAAKKLFLTGVIHVETLLDKRMMEAIADKDPSIKGMKLGRFDRPLFAIRERIRDLYWGDDTLVQLHRGPAATRETA